MITGATGFVGTEVLARYLERSDRDVVLLVRADGEPALRNRLRSVLSDLCGDAGRYADRVEAVAADLTAPNLGLTRAERDRLAERVTTIVHSAASVSFSLPLEQAREINLEGTRRVLQFARLAQARGGLERYGHVSTAYVAGTHVGRFTERDLDLGQGFHNSYEESKFEAERLVRAERELPYAIMRPSIVVGDRRSGWTSAFNVLYWPLRAFARGLFRTVPAVASAPVDVVSVDYVADAIHALCESRDRSQATYHLTAGANASTMLEIAHAASRYFKRPVPRLVAPEEFSAAMAPDGGGAYFPYFSIGAVFDESRARAALEPAGISPSPLRDYIERLLDYATRTRWGKLPVARAHALLA